MNIPEELKYTREHEWVRVQGALPASAEAIIGITAYAQEQLGDIVLVDLPPVGKEIKQNDAFGTVESVKSVSDIFAPVAGTVVAINDRLKDAPEVVNTDPYGQGWMVRVKVADTAQLGGLLSAADYRKHVEASGH